MKTGKKEFLFYTDWDDRVTGSASALAGRLVSFATEFGLSGNVWQQWLTYTLMMHENAFTRACERREILPDSTLMKLAKLDLGTFMELFGADDSDFDDDEKVLSMMLSYKAPYDGECITGAGRRIEELSSRLASTEDIGEFARILTEYYSKYGSGIYGLYKAFRVDPDAAAAGELTLVPVADAADVTFDDLVGYETQKKTLKDNTEAFVSGLFANNVLLYGDSGTGKSTSIHALMHDYAESGLRLAEITKADRSKLPKVLSEIKKRNYKFILFLDDLSFEEDESDYKELKAMLEGALESGKDRVLIYATSNRRHLVREVWRDRSDMEHDGDVHRSDTLEEKLSLASRFGITIYFPKPNQEEYMNIVKKLAETNSIKVSEKELEDLARKWEIKHGGKSGRVASQLIAWLKAEESSSRYLRIQS